MAKKIYLSGKISGDPDFKEKFALKEKELTEQGHLVFNPALHPDMFTWEQFMELDLKALGNCDAIYLLEDWKDSRGAKIEYDEAVKLGKEIIFENKLEQNIDVKKESPSDITPDFLAEKYVSDKADRGNFDTEQFGKAYFSESSLKKAWLDGFNAAKDVLLQLDNLKKDQRLTVSYRQNNENKKVPAQLSEYKNWKFRVTLDDNSITPWQYFDHEPKGEDYIEVKEYYTRLKEKGEDYTIAPKNNNKLNDYKKEIWNDYISSVRSFLSKEDLNNKNKVLEASKMALACQSDVEGATGIINTEFANRGVKSKATLIKAIKEAAYPELIQKKAKSKNDDLSVER